jgi:hypothetical protein
VDGDIDVPAFARDRDLREVAREGLERAPHLRALHGATVAPGEHATILLPPGVAVLARTLIAEIEQGEASRDRPR